MENLLRFSPRSNSKLITYEGKQYTPEELAAYLEIREEFEIHINDSETTWFQRAIKNAEEEE